VTARIAFSAVGIRDFRNIRELDFEPAPRINVIAGDNGQGKTSVLEALYFVATSKSFRTEKAEELRRTSTDIGSVRADIEEAGQRREQRALLRPGARALFIDGKRAARFASYATRTPVVVFHPGDLTLVSGGAAGRRRLLDRVALYMRPTSGDARSRYEKALRDRQRTLETRGPSAPELDAYEELCARFGAELSGARAEASAALGGALLASFSRLSAAELVLSAEYRPGGTDDPETFRSALGRARGIDLRRGSASFGPQRDDYELVLDGRSARQHASQGQQRVLTLALKAAELSSVREVRGAHPILLLDDVSSELDPTRTGAVYGFVRELESQVFVTTTRPELFVTPEIAASERADWSMLAGVVTRLS
jgi:DNA replication and repair protein RecF